MGLTVACVFRSGGDFTQDYVDRLRDGIARNLSDYEFVCLSDDKLRHKWPGWWSKIELFLLEPPVLYFDLDTVITGDLTDLAQQAIKPEFTALRDFYWKDRLQSSVMGWAIDLKYLYDKFCSDAHNIMQDLRFKGDQTFIEQNVPSFIRWQDKLPGQIVSYKVHCKDTIPNDARVVCFHGRPRPVEVEWLTSLAR